MSACLISLPIIALFQGAIPLCLSQQERLPRERRCWPRPPLHARADDLHFPKVHCPTRSHSVIAPTEPKRGESERGGTDWESFFFFFYRNSQAYSSLDHFYARPVTRPPLFLSIRANVLRPTPIFPPSSLFLQLTTLSLPLTASLLSSDCSICPGTTPSMPPPMTPPTARRRASRFKLHKLSLGR